MTVYESSIPMPPLPQCKNAVGGLLASPFFANAANLTKTAYVDAASGQSYTWGDFLRLIPRLAALFRNEYGVKKGDFVALSSVNGIFTAPIHHAVVSLGAIISPANVQYNAEELAHQVRMTRPSLLIAVDPVLPVAEEAVKSSGVPNVRILKISELLPRIESLVAAESAPEVAPVDVDLESDLALCCFSSGTSGLPKGVMTTHLNILSNMLQVSHCEAPYITTNLPVGAVLPMSHIFGLQIFLWGSPYIGLTVVVFSKFNFAEFLEGCTKYNVGILYLVPPIILLLGKHPLLDKYPKFKEQVKFILSGAAPLSKSTGDLVTARAPGITVYQAYGLTETSPAILLGGLLPGYKLETVGWLVPGSRARLVDPDTGEDAAPGARGELWLAGPQIMKGYLHNEKATKETLTPDGWLRTGDVAVVDESGQFQVVDRIKELIKSKGHQVAPAELEAIMLTNPAVADVAIIGVPDEHRTTEFPRAYLVLRPNSNVHEVLTWFNKRVAMHKRLWGGAVVVDEVPKSPSGKILRRYLRDKKEDPSKVVGIELAKL